MASAKLNFDETKLNKKSSLYIYYDKLYRGMEAASTIEPPDYTTSPPLTSTGAVDVELISERTKEYSKILMKNSAYLFAETFSTTLEKEISSISGGMGDFLPRSGGNMSGHLNALQGFQAGIDGVKVLEVRSDDEGKVLSIKGQLALSNDGITFLGNKTIFYNGNTLNLASDNIKLSGNIGVAGSIRVGDVEIHDGGILWGDKDFYHSGNSNNFTTDWSARNLVVQGATALKSTLTVSGAASLLYGFDLGVGGNKVFYSAGNDIKVDTDIYIKQSKSLFLGDKKALYYNGQGVVISANGSKINLGGDNTSHVDLLCDIKNSSSDYTIVSSNGDGNFPNSFSAGCGNATNTVVRSYFLKASDCGLQVLERLRFGNSISSSSSLHSNKDSGLLEIEVPYSQSFKGSLTFDAGTDGTTNFFRLSTNLHHFRFNKFIEAIHFKVNQTKLGDNTLFFNSNSFFEGLSKGIRHVGDSLFEGDLSSSGFSTGFLGGGWGITKDPLSNDIRATFDNITIRKKMRVYELEVQKHSVSNGALWVTDSCSGDIVEEVL